MSSVEPKPQENEDTTEKSWKAMMQLGRTAGISMIMLGIARFLFVLATEGKNVLDATTVGSVGLGALAIVLTAIAPSPSSLQAIGEARKAKHEETKVKQD